MTSLLRALRTARHLRLRQITNRAVRRFYSPPARLGESLPLRVARPGRAPSFLPRPPTTPDGREFRLLNISRVVEPEEFGQAKEPLLWDYCFHYFEGLLASELDPGTKREWIETWLRHVPVGASPAWDAYPTSRRLLNWSKWVHAGGQPPADFRESACTQVRHLRTMTEYHLMANHLLTNATAITAAGATFGGREGDRWLAEGLSLLERELSEQFLSGGAHFELSPTYHCMLAEDLLDLTQILGRAGVAIPETLQVTILRALRWIRWIQRPDGRVPLFNDASYDSAPDAAQLLEYAALLGYQEAAVPEDPLTLDSSSGYFRYSFRRLFLLGDVGPIGPSYQPGHGHCDALSFELAWDGVPILVDTGTSTYEPGRRRMIERGTAAHNTVQLDDREQSEIWHAFRVGRRARISGRLEGASGVRGTVEGFHPLNATVERTWRFSAEAVHVVDRVLTHGDETPGATARFHFSPGIEPVETPAGWVAGAVLLKLQGARRAALIDYEYAPEFHCRVPARCLEVDFRDELATTISGAGGTE